MANSKRRNTQEAQMRRRQKSRVTAAHGGNTTTPQSQPVAIWLTLTGIAGAVVTVVGAVTDYLNHSYYYIVGVGAIIFIVCIFAFSKGAVRVALVLAAVAGLLVAFAAPVYKAYGRDGEFALSDCGEVDTIGARGLLQADAISYAAEAVELYYPECDFVQLALNKSVRDYDVTVSLTRPGILGSTVTSPRTRLDSFAPGESKRRSAGISLLPFTARCIEAKVTLHDYAEDHSQSFEICPPEGDSQPKK